MTSGGTGIAHSEFNPSKTEPTHFLQIWAKPYQSGLKPQYFTRHFTDEDKMDKIVAIVAPAVEDGVTEEREGKGPTPVHSALHAFAAIISPGIELDHALHSTLKGPGEKLFYAQLIQTSGYSSSAASKQGAQVTIKHGESIVTLGEGDGVFVRGGKTGDTLKVINTSDRQSELVLFEMDP